MPIGSLIKLTLVLWLAAEVLVFVLVAKLIGAPGALLLALFTTVLGWTLLKRAGASAVVKLRAVLNGRHAIEGDGREVFEYSLASLAALALLIPGFLSDAAGLLLAIPAAQARLARWIAGSRFGRMLRQDWRRPDRGPTTIDLRPGDWERTGSSKLS